MRKFVLLFSLVLFVGTQLSAQNQRVSGTVTGPDGAPVIGVTVLVEGTQTAAFTDPEGRYSISVPANANLVYSYFGMLPQTLAVGGRTVINVAMAADVQSIDRVVVTALGITRAEKTLGYSATTVRSDDVVGARTTNVASSLSGKVAGLQVSSTSSDPGSVSNITIRGFSSINGNNQPLYVVDGVPLQSSSAFGQGKNVVVGGVANISPEDIESMTVLKGAAATALYGSRAANGVIVVTTKSGTRSDGRNFVINYSGNVQASRVSVLPQMQNEFGQGWNGKQTFNENGSWGPRLDGSTQVYGPAWNNTQLIHEYDAKKNNVKDFFETGVSHNHNLSISGLSNDEKMDYYLSFSHSSDDGIMPGKSDTFKRTTLAFRNNFDATNWLRVSSSVNFARNATDAVGSFQGTSVIDGLYEMPRDVSIVDMKDLSSPFNTPEAYYTPYGITNPYWSLANNYNHTDAKQIYGKVQLDIKPISDLTVSYRMGFDYIDNDTKIGEPQISLDDALITNDYGTPPSGMNQTGRVWARYSRSYEMNHDILANYSTSFLDGRLELDVNAGTNINERAMTRMTGETNDLSFYSGFWQLSNGATRTILGEAQEKRRLIGLFGDVTLGWDGMLFLNLTARNDWSSTLPIGNNSFFYPGATLSWIFTNMLPQNRVLSFGKLRMAYGQTGNDAAPYRTGTNYVQGYASSYYTDSGINFPMGGVNAFQANHIMGSTTLRPEMTSEFEAGINLQFLTGRIGIDAAYYNRTTKDQIFELPVDPATGYTRKVFNFGSVRNQGIELLLTTVPVQTGNFRWDLSFNFAKNNNTVLTLPEGLEGGKVMVNSFGAGDDAIYMYAVQGLPIGQFFGYLPQYTPDGRPIVDAQGQHVKSTDMQDTGKNMNNDWNGGISTALSYKGISLSATLDIRSGGYMLSRTKNIMQFVGNSTPTLYNDRNPFIIPGSVKNTGTADSPVYVENTTPIYLSNSSYQTYFDQGYGSGTAAYLIDRSFVKLRNISLSWSLPRRWASALSLSRIELTAYCNNVFTWTASDNNFIDPESTTYEQSATGGDLAMQFGETYSNPASRIFGGNLSITF